MKQSFFISYASKDVKWAEWVAWIIEEQGHSTVIYQWDFKPGNNFVVEMQNGIKKTDFMIVILSKNYLTANFTWSEWASVFSKDPKGLKSSMIPIKVDDCKPDGLIGQIVYIDLNGLSKVEAKNKINFHIKAIIDETRLKPDKHPPFPDLNLDDTTNYFSLIRNNLDLLDDNTHQNLIDIIIDTFDHDLTKREMKEIKKVLSNHEVLISFISFLTGDDRTINDELKELAENKIEKILSVDEGIGVDLHGIPISIKTDRRINRLYKFICEHSEEEIIRTLNKLREKYDYLSEEYWREFLNLFDIGYMDELESIIYGIHKLLIRKEVRASQSIFMLSSYIGGYDMVKMEKINSKYTGLNNPFQKFLTYMCKKHPIEHRKFISKIGEQFYNNPEFTKSLINDAILTGTNQKMRSFFRNRGVI